LVNVSTVQMIVDEFRNGASSEHLASMPLPESYFASYVSSDDVPDRAVEGGVIDVRKTLKAGDVEVPEIAPDEVLIAVMASCVNYNTVWTAQFTPQPTFRFLERLGREGRWGARHDLSYHVSGSDASGFVIRTGSLVNSWKVGDQVIVHGNHVDALDAMAQDDAMQSTSQRAWGYETNFGGLAELAVAKASQLLPRPKHLTWEECASTMVCGAAAYRMLVGAHGARMRQGEAVLIWGAAGGMGSYATQFVLNGGGIPIAVVSSPERADVVRAAGCERVIDRSIIDLTPGDDGLPSMAGLRALGSAIRELAQKDPEIVFEHPGRDTIGASVFVAARGGRVVTSAATSGPIVSYDNRHLWMRVKSIVGSHFANARECAEFNELLQRGMVVPTVSMSFPLADVAEATSLMAAGTVPGKIAVRCCCEADEGVEDPAMRSQVGDERINRYRV
jgi:crotonyl-CoA reductase